MNKISIAQALAYIDQPVQEDEAVTFSLDYVKADGNLGRIDKAQKSFKNVPATHPVAKSGNTSFRHNIKKSGNLLLYSHDKRSYREIKIALIVRFNNIPVFHG